MLPEHRLRVVADGASASLLRYESPRTVVITRLRCDAAISDPARTSAQVYVRGQMAERLLWSCRRTRPPPLAPLASIKRSRASAVRRRGPVPHSAMLTRDSQICLAIPTHRLN